MKKFITGLIVGVMLSVLPISAAIEEYICYKADYKVMINGEEYINKEFPVLNYKGTTYAPLKSVLEKTGSNATWNAELGQLEIASNPAILQNDVKENSTMIRTITSGNRKVYPLHKTIEGRYIDISIDNVIVNNSISLTLSIKNKSPWEITTINPTIYVEDNIESGLRCKTIQTSISPNASIEKTIVVESEQAAQFVQLLFLITNDSRPEFQSGIENFTWRLD